MWGLSTQDLIELVEEVNQKCFDRTNDQDVIPPLTYVTDGGCDIIEFYGEQIFCSENFVYDPDDNEQHKGRSEYEACLMELSKSMNTILKSSRLVLDVLEEIAYDEADKEVKGDGTDEA